MIKRFNVLYIPECEDDEIYNRVEILLEKGHTKFKYDGDESIFYKSEDREEIQKYLGIKINENNEESLNMYISCMDGGEYLQLTNHLEISIGNCIEKLQESINEYEDRIWNSNDINEEISKILKEQMYKVFLEIIEDGFKTINNGNFDWR